VLIEDEKTNVLMENNYYCEFVESACYDNLFDCENCKLYIEKIKGDGGIE